MDRRLRPAALLLLALAASGCAVTRPTLSFKNARVADVDLEGTTLQLTFALKNPNPIALSLATAAYDLEVEGRKVVSGRPPNGLRMAANGTTDLSFPARIRFQDIVPALQTFLTKDKAAYRASGKVGIQTPIGVVELPLSYAGSFPVPKVPKVSFQAPRIQGLSLQGARVVFPLQVKNGNAFALPLGGLSASFTVAGARIGSAQAALPARLAAGGEQVVELPVDVNFLQVGFGVMNALKSRQAPVKLEGALKSGNASVPISLQETLRFR